jgi:hypothetical protein
LLTPSSSGAQCILQRGGIVRRLHPNCLQKIGISAPSLVVLCRPASPVLAHCRYGRPLFLLLILLGLFFASLFARMSGPSSA